MKFAICNETFQDWPLDRAFASAAECGYTGVEIAPFTLAARAGDVSHAERKEIRRQTETAGLEVVGLHWLLAKTEGFHLTSPDAAVRQRTADYLVELALLCSDLGGKVMVFGSPVQRSLAEGVTKAQGMSYAAEVLCKILPVLEANRVVLAVEPLTSQETNFLVTAAEAVELIDRISSSQIQLHLDCKAMMSEATPIVDLIRQNRDLLAHFHANDPNRQGPGFGSLDFVPIFKALKEVRYDGWISVEVFDFSPGIERLARESIEYMRAIVDVLAEDS
ncbi:MAG: sugar phosphate isomerase/epimerase family protein [Thermoguttaceae bacterium]|jgi:sugar phosphate isomerase/epimerase